MIIGYSFHAGDVGLHAGHVWQLRQSKRWCDYLIVGILTDRAIRSYKREPAIPYAYRIVPYEACRYVDRVVPQNSRDPTDNLKNFKPDILFHGDDWDNVPGSEWMLANGRRIIKTPYFEGLSTTEVVAGVLREYGSSGDLCQ